MVEGKVVENYVANVRSDTDRVLGVVSGRYTIVQPDEGCPYLNLMDISNGWYNKTSGGVQNVNKKI